MDDVAPDILDSIEKDFKKNLAGNSKIAELEQKIKDGTATYIEANEYAIALGHILAAAYKNNISTDKLPDGKMYYNIAKRIIEPTMQNNYNIISKAAVQIQESLNDSAGIGIKAIQPPINSDRIDGIINRVSDSENFNDIAWILDEPVVNFSQSIVDDAIKVNSEFQANAGLEAKIIRRDSGRCCEWCSRLAGTYTYPDVPKDVYRRHQRCRCTVDYIPKKGQKKQNVWTKKWKDQDEYDKIEKRKNIAKPETQLDSGKLEKAIEEETGLAYQLSKHPQMFQAYTPKGLKQSLENAGYDVKPLGKGNFKGIPFEEGGGFRISYGGDGYLQYHPESRSHHGGAYYKTSNGKDRTHYYNMKGEEINKDGTIKEKKD